MAIFHGYVSLPEGKCSPPSELSHVWDSPVKMHDLSHSRSVMTPDGHSRLTRQCPLPNGWFGQQFSGHGLSCDANCGFGNGQVRGHEESDNFFWYLPSGNDYHNY